MKTTIELVYGLPQKELVERLHFHQRQNEVSERALGFYLLDMQKRNAFQPEKDAAAWAKKHLSPCGNPQKLIHLARCLEELPRMAEAFAEGEIPWTKIREVARVATAETEEAWLDFARRSTSREIEREVMGKKRGDKPGEGFKARRLKFIERLMFSAAGKVIWDQAIRKIMKEMGKGTTPSEAALHLARLGLLSDPEGQIPGRKPNGQGIAAIALHIGADGKRWIDTEEGRESIDKETFEEIARLGATVTEVKDVVGTGDCPAIRLGERGEVAPEDRAPKVTAEVKAAVLLRDGACVICGRTEDLTPHHLDSHADGGTSDMSRLVTLCLSCQGRVHAHEVVIRIEADGSISARDREGVVVTKARSAAEVLEGAGEECPLATIETRGAPEPLLEIHQPHQPPAAGLPATFDDFVGQRGVVENLKLTARAAKLKGRTLDHVLLSGPAGLGKTSLARLLAVELGSTIEETMGRNLADPQRLISVLAGLHRGDILFIDELHALGSDSEELLYSAMKECVVSVHQGGGIERLALEPFTLVGATTCPGALSEPFRSRFGIHLRLEHYGEEDLAELVIRAAEGMEIAATAQAAREIARRARGTPREALRILDRSRDVAELTGSRVLDLAHVGEAAGRLGIDLNGLDPVDRKAVKLLLKLGRPIGQEALAARLGIDRATFHEVHEPYLERLGLIERTERGRVATEEARRLYGQEPAAPTWAASPAPALEPRLAHEFC